MLNSAYIKGAGHSGSDLATQNMMFVAFRPGAASLNPEAAKLLKRNGGAARARGAARPRPLEMRNLAGPPARAGPGKAARGRGQALLARFWRC